MRVHHDSNELAILNQHLSNLPQLPTSVAEHYVFIPRHLQLVGRLGGNLINIRGSNSTPCQSSKCSADFARVELPIPIGEVRTQAPDLSTADLQLNVFGGRMRNGFHRDEYFIVEIPRPWSKSPTREPVVLLNNNRMGIEAFLFDDKALQSSDQSAVIAYYLGTEMELERGHSWFQR